MRLSMLLALLSERTVTGIIARLGSYLSEVKLEKKKSLKSRRKKLLRWTKVLIASV